MLTPVTKQIDSQLFAARDQLYDRQDIAEIGWSSSWQWSFQSEFGRIMQRLHQEIKQIC